MSRSSRLSQAVGRRLLLLALFLGLLGMHGLAAAPGGWSASSSSTASHAEASTAAPGSPLVGGAATARSAQGWDATAPTETALQESAPGHAGGTWRAQLATDGAHCDHSEGMPQHADPTCASAAPPGPPALPDLTSVPIALPDDAAPLTWSALPPQPHRTLPGRAELQIFRI